ncbi:MAG TPA: hypothetical protein VH877_22220 [Polyangia bacterium]|nr:hypothetical protein [Polyangia bacterium]
MKTSLKPKGGRYHRVRQVDAHALGNSRAERNALRLQHLVAFAQDGGPSADRATATFLSESWRAGDLGPMGPPGSGGVSVGVGRGRQRISA